jgi:hypothetical protein
MHHFRWQKLGLMSPDLQDGWISVLLGPKCVDQHSLDDKFFEKVCAKNRPFLSSIVVCMPAYFSTPVPRSMHIL